MLQPKKIGVLEVFPSDFPKLMNLREANVACAKLGDGWRLPSSGELNVLNQYQDLIGGFTKPPLPYFYWTDKYNAEHYILTDDLEFNERLEKTFLLVRPVRIKGQTRNYCR